MTDPALKLGVCPVCGNMSRMLNNGRDQWALCDEHEMAWYVGTNINSSWRAENADVWAANRRIIEHYDHVIIVDSIERKSPETPAYNGEPV